MDWSLDGGAWVCLGIMIFIITHSIFFKASSSTQHCDESHHD